MPPNDRPAWAIVFERAGCSPERILVRRGNYADKQAAVMRFAELVGELVAEGGCRGFAVTVHELAACDHEGP